MDNQKTTQIEEEIRLYAPGGAPRIVAIGGGHGLSTMLRGLKRYSRDITAIVTMADDGGGSGMLRQDLGMLPPGDARDCVLALANTEPVMEQLMTYRFQEGSLEGQNFGNLLLAALNGICGSFAEAVRQMGWNWPNSRPPCPVPHGAAAPADDPPRYNPRSPRPGSSGSSP